MVKRQVTGSWENRRTVDKELRKNFLLRSAEDGKVFSFYPQFGNRLQLFSEIPRLCWGDSKRWMDCLGDAKEETSQSRYKNLPIRLEKPI